MLDVASIRAETPSCWQSTFLNSAGASLMPKPVVQAMRQHLDLEVEVGGYAAASRAADALESVYRSVGQLIGATAEEIALFDSATAAWQMAFYSVPLSRGDIVLTSEAEYGANYVALLHRRQQVGFDIVVVPSDVDTGEIDLLALARLMTSRVKLISLTWVPTNGGLVNPAHAVGKIARAHGVPYLLDACQAAGQLPIDVDSLGCDMLSATGRKFLRGPRGTGFLYVRKSYMERLVPHTVDHSSALWVQTDRFELRADARRYEHWESNCVARLGLGAAIDYAQRVGIEEASERSLSLAAYMRARLAECSGVHVQDLGRAPCAIVTFTMDDTDASAFAARAADEKIFLSVSSPASTRLDASRRSLPDLVRASPHYFNTEAEIDLLIRFVVSRPDR